MRKGQHMKAATPIAFAALLLAACAPQAQRDEQKTAERKTETSHGGMGMTLDPDNPDRSFAEGMIPHHRDAVKMAEAQLRLGRDPELRALATKIIKDQQSEIDQLERWLARPQDDGSKQ